MNMRNQKAAMVSLCSRRLYGSGGGPSEHSEANGGREAGNDLSADESGTD